MGKGIAFGLLRLLAVAALCVIAGTGAVASPYFLTDSEIEWREAMSMGRIQPMTPVEWSDYMMQWSMHLVEGDPYPVNVFAPPELYVWGGGGGGGLDPEDAGLVMVWGGTSPGSYSSAWKWVYGLDPDLTGSTINISVTAPQFSPLTGNQVNNVSFGIRDINGFIRSWNWNCGPGGPIPWNTPTQITINPMTLSVNAATPAASGFANNPLFNIANSALFIVDENAVWVAQQGVPPPGQQIPRMWNYWHSLSVTPPIPPKFPDPLKWSQPVVEYQPGLKPPVFYGWDEKSLHMIAPICADDWECTDARPVTDIHWWGSFLGWTQPIPPQLPRAFQLAIWTDVPQGPNNLYSHPGTMIWEHYCDTFTWNFAGYDYDPRGQMENEACFQFHQYIPRDKWFYQDPGPTGRNVYWLSIAAVYDISIPQYPWGWKTRPHFFNDDAVRIRQVIRPDGNPGWPPTIGCTWAQGEPIVWEDQSWDLAFELTTVETEQWDFGDAPEPPYPTKKPNGACHKIMPGLCLGAQIDAEADGQPDATATGDDNGGIDDEDGVTFPAAVLPGQNNTCTISVTGMPGTTYFIDAWIDFNGNGVWTDPAEQIAAGLPVFSGPLNSVSFFVPATTTPGVSRAARFRLSTTGGLGVSGAANDGEVEDYMVPIGFKWIQKPDLSTTGIDVNCTQPFILADDFLCGVTGPITDIHIWGSWWHDILPMQDPTQVKFRLSIHKDIPSGQQGEYSRPGEVLWYREFLPGQFQATLYASGIDEGWMNPPAAYEFPGDHNCWKYDFQIDENPFIQRGTPEKPVVYWLDVQAEPIGGTDARFGWKTSLEHWNDDAVWGQGIEPYPGPWYELRYPPNHELQVQSIDLAFAITGKAEEPPQPGNLTFARHSAIPDHFWTPWPSANRNNMLCMDVSADTIENIRWKTLQLTHSGSGNTADITAVEVWQDVDGDCKWSSPDILLGTGTYSAGIANIALTAPPIIPAGSTLQVVLTYAMSNTPVSPVGSVWRFQVTAASGTGETSGLSVGILGLPVTSSTKVLGLKPISIGRAKLLPVGTQFVLEEKICTADFQSTMGLFYIEEPDRSAGIGVDASGAAAIPVNVWDRVSVLGTCALINGTELVVVPQYTIVTPGVAPPMGSPRFAVGLNNKWTGGGAFGGQPGTYDDAWTNAPSYGLNDVGMLITTWGEVTYHQPNFALLPLMPTIPAGDMFWINDGANLLDGTTNMLGLRNVGIACWLPRGYPGLPNPREYWGVTGILRTFPSPMGIPMTEPVRLLVPRMPSDMVRYR